MISRQNFKKYNKLTPNQTNKQLSFDSLKIFNDINDFEVFAYHYTYIDESDKTKGVIYESGIKLLKQKILYHFILTVKRMVLNQLLRYH